MLSVFVLGLCRCGEIESVLQDIRGSNRRSRAAETQNNSVGANGSGEKMTSFTGRRKRKVASTAVPK